jgi:hypothetical protein
MDFGKAAECPVKERLERLVQHHLKELAGLANVEAEILKTADQARIIDVDKRIENLVGEKERSLGALKQHRAEHGC